MPSISLSVGCCISIIGLIGVCTRRGALVFLFISLELVLLGFGLIFTLLSCYYVDGDGYIMALVLITVTAVEAVLGLGLLVLYYNLFRNAAEYSAAFYLRV